jgi:transposase
MLAKRHKQLASLKTQAACRLHAVLAALIPGGLGKEMVSRQASQLLRRIRPATMVEAERKRIAHQLLTEVRRLDKELAASKARLKVAVEAAGTTLTDIYGVGAVVAGLLIGYTGDVSRFPMKHHYAAYNGSAPIEASSGAWKRHPQPQRQPDAQPCPPSDRHHPTPLPRHPRTTVLRTETGRWGYPLDIQTGIDMGGSSRLRIGSCGR